MTRRSATTDGSVRFSAFAATLVGETLEAVTSAHIHQEEHLGALRTAAALDTECFAEEVVPREEAEEELARRLPSSRGGSAIAPGAVYLPAGDGRREAPPVLARTGYLMQEGRDWEVRCPEGPAVVTVRGHEAVLTHLRRQLAETRRQALRAMLAAGVPRVAVDHGRICAKVFFEVLRPSPATVSPHLRDGARPGSAFAAPSLGVAVRTADARRPEIAREALVGEVEICFKTVFG